MWSFIVRPIAVGGMMVGACYTLFRMRKSLALGMSRAVSDLKKSAAAHAATNRTERDLNAKIVFGGIGRCAALHDRAVHQLRGDADRRGASSPRS